MAVLVGWGVALSWGQGYHVFGTDRTGNDVLYMTLKSVRTAFVIGSLATIATLPFALIFGIAAGYFKGWVDDVIQYIYTVLSSVPNILLIAACLDCAAPVVVVSNEVGFGIVPENSIAGPSDTRSSPIRDALKRPIQLAAGRALSWQGIRLESRIPSISISGSRNSA
mgnify:CR=1 FL=1